jgi:hypothetical protein
MKWLPVPTTLSGPDPGHFAESVSGSRLLLNQDPIRIQTKVFVAKRKFWIENRNIGLLKLLQRTYRYVLYRLREKPPAQEKTFQTPNFNILSCFWGQFFLLVAGSGSSPNPDPKQ